ncbi:uncharacterized protein LOC120357653 [Solenopsis invicta]|uniref:uncharacterized protein LOC120357653 n=1 Tax=Solenopsis invicta TaxID=13686 RepID=UPI00193EA723|nr:uncharacterized protein LOC120357653 [Solenopsis invicta]
MRNGSSTELQAVKIEDQNYCFINTCAFDSVLQIVLAALSDYKDFETEIRKIENNKLYEMALDILEKGIRAYTYKLRAQILLPFSKPRNVQCGNCIQVDCQTNVGYLASQLFRNSPSFEENSICDKGCPVRSKSLPVSQIDYNHLLQADNYNIIKNNVLLKGSKKCYRENCTGFETTKLCKIGN